MTITPDAVQKAIQQVQDEQTLLAFLRHELQWRIAEDAELFRDATYTWSNDDLQLDETCANVQFRQLKPFVPNQWAGIFLVKFPENAVAYKTTLRKALRTLVTKKRGGLTHKTWALEDLSKQKDIDDFKAVPYITLKNLTSESWTISSDIERRIREKIERIGKPFKEWDVQIYRGVLTGYNEAFIIDEKKKDELIKQDPKSAEILKPILRGRDIKRYKAEFADLWLIATFPALKLNIDDYPAIKAYLKSFGKRLNQTGEVFIDENGEKIKSRKKTGNKWFETQDQISYYKEFEKEKIIYPNMTLFLPFVFDDKGFYTNQKCFIITSKTVNLKFLIAFFNSKISHRWIRENCPELQGGTRELSKIFFENIPIPVLSESEQKPFIELVDQILEGKEKGEDTTALEREIDERVYRLYGLTAEEIALVEGRS